MRMPAARARTQYEYGRMLVRSDRPDDAKRGLKLLSAALETARSLGMTVLEEKLSALLAWSSQPTSSVADATTEAAPESAHEIFRREGEYWTITYEGQTFRCGIPRASPTSPSCSATRGENSSRSTWPTSAKYSSEATGGASSTSRLSSERARASRSPSGRRSRGSRGTARSWAAISPRRSGREKFARTCPDPRSASPMRR